MSKKRSREEKLKILRSLEEERVFDYISNHLQDAPFQKLNTLSYGERQRIMEIYFSVKNDDKSFSCAVREAAIFYAKEKESQERSINILLDSRDEVKLKALEALRAYFLKQDIKESYPEIKKKDMTEIINIFFHGEDSNLSFRENLKEAVVCFKKNLY